MSDLIDLDISVVSNFDLSAEKIHALYERMVAGVTEKGEEALRLNAAASVTKDWPRPTPGAMVEHVGSEGPIDVGDAMHAEIGVRPVEEARERPYASFFEEDPANYPMFKDQGTGLFGPDENIAITSPSGGTMRFESPEGSTLFRKHVTGQEGAHFMEHTYEEIIRTILPGQVEIFEEEIKRTS